VFLQFELHINHVNLVRVHVPIQETQEGSAFSSELLGEAVAASLRTAHYLKNEEFPSLSLYRHST
jgi:hypothetical protein